MGMKKLYLQPSRADKCQTFNRMVEFPIPYSPSQWAVPPRTQTDFDESFLIII